MSCRSGRLSARDRVFTGIGHQPSRRIETLLLRSPRSPDDAGGRFGAVEAHPIGRSRHPANLSDQNSHCVLRCFYVSSPLFLCVGVDA